MKIDHIGIVTKSLNEGIQQWKEVFGYLQQTRPIVNTLQKVNVVFMTKKGSTDIKLIEPTDESSPVYRFAMRGGGLHHLCFLCDEMKTSIKHLSSKKCRLINKPMPGEAFKNENIAFLLASSNLNIELIDTEKRAGVIRI